MIPEPGAAIRREWALDPNYVTVNHGSYGATPRRVLDAQDSWRRRMEAQPTRFMTIELPDALREAASGLAAFVGADAADIAFVENATTGCNAVLRSLRLAPGDEILMLSHVYGAVRNTIRHVAERQRAEIVEVALPFPRTTPEAVVAALSAALSPRTRIAVLDHVTSRSAWTLPLEHMVATCHSAGVQVLVDGAHAPGYVPLDLKVLGADWYVGNCHKWMMAPKGCGFLHARADRQEDLHPVTVSHGYGGGFLAEFDWTGTRDPSACLAVTEAIAFYHYLGGQRLYARNAELAAAAAAMLAERLGTQAVADGGAMALVRLPWQGPATDAAALALRAMLLPYSDAPINAEAGGMWLRLSALAYNEIADYRRLGELLETLPTQ